MRIGLSYDLKEAVPVDPAAPRDALEEYDSRETVDIIEKALGEAGHPVVRLGGGREFLVNVLREKVDMVFNIAEGRGNYRSREAQVPSVLEMLGIPYSGSDPQCLDLCLDKALAKQLAASAGISTPGWRVIRDREELAGAIGAGLPSTAIVKPVWEGSSKGVGNNSLASGPEQIAGVAERLLEDYRQPVMVEEFIHGDEITVGVLGNDPPAVLGIMRVLPKTATERFVYSLEVKRDYENLVDYECPARLGDRVLAEIERDSLKIFETLGCRDFARLDFRVTPAGVPYFIEINPLPGLGTYSDLVIMAGMLGWTHERLIRAVLEAAVARCAPCVTV